MVRVILCVVICLAVTATSFKTVSADETVNASEAVLNSLIDRVYKEIDFGNTDIPLAEGVFAKAYRGYLNLRAAGKLNMTKAIISICDFSMPSSSPRLWIIDLLQKKVLFHTYVAHGEGSGDDYATAFSNDANSHESSLGFYVTGETYDGEHGLSLRLNGVDEGFNDAAFDRGIVVHGADYVCSKFVAAHQRLGHSWGCPAVPAKLSRPIVNTIDDSTCLFVYFPDEHYLSSGYWLNKKITSLPEDIMYADLPQAQSAN